MLAPSAQVGELWSHPADSAERKCPEPIEAPPEADPVEQAQQALAKAQVAKARALESVGYDS